MLCAPLLFKWGSAICLLRKVKIVFIHYWSFSIIKENYSVYKRGTFKHFSASTLFASIFFSAPSLGAILDKFIEQNQHQSIKNSTKA